MNNDLLKWLSEKYASDGIGEVKAVHGHRHDYLAMVLDYSLPGVLRVDMTSYVKKSMLENFPENLNGVGNFPVLANC